MYHSYRFSSFIFVIIDRTYLSPAVQSRADILWSRLSAKWCLPFILFMCVFWKPTSSSIPKVKIRAERHQMLKATVPDLC